LRRVYVPQEHWPQGAATVSLTGPLQRHLGLVLRCRVGDEFELFDGEGREAPARVTDVDARRIELAVGATAAGKLDVQEPLVLLQGLAKGDRMDLVVQKTTELGVTRIVPVICARSVARPGEGAQRITRWRTIAREAARQSGRADVPQVDAPMSFADALAGLGPLDDTRLALWEEARGAPLLAALPETGAVALLVGPEGGLERDEIAQAGAAGFAVVDLGKRILRTETAAIVAVALAQAARGGFA